MSAGSNWSRLFAISAVASALISFFTGCKMAPLQVIAQPREVLPAPQEMPRIPEPSATAAEVPAGYQVEVVVKGLTYPSSVEFDNAGNMYVAESGYVYGDPNAPARIMRFDKNGRSMIVAEELNGPITDLLWHQDRLYISHKGKVSVLEGNSVRDIVTGLPSLGDHENNQLTVGPDGKIYIGQGTASNSGVIGVDNFVFGWLMEHPEFHDVSPYPLQLRGQTFISINPLMLTSDKEKKLVRTGAFQPLGSTREVADTNIKANGTILRFNADGSDLQVFAWGLRNPFGVMFAPDCKLYVADNGFDGRGSRPIANAPDVIWQVRQDGWYGWPDYAGGIPVTDPQFKPAKGPQPQFLLSKHPPVEEPILRIKPHAGVTKVDFSRSERFGFAGQMFVACVGDMEPITGNDKRPAGFEVFRFDPQSGEARPFFRAKRESLGQKYLEYVTTAGPKRLVDVKFAPEEDSLYIADIGAIMVYPTPTPSPHPFPGSGVIWRISREGTQPKFPSGLAVRPIVTTEPAGAAREKNQQ